MSIFDGSEFVWGVAGVPGTGVSSGEKAGILSRLDALEGAGAVSVLGDLGDVRTTDIWTPSDGDMLRYNGGASTWEPYTLQPITVVTGLPFVISGGGSEITTGIKEGDIVVPFAGTITGWTLLPDQSGSISIAAWKDSYANYPPDSGDTLLTMSITAAAKNQATGLSHAVSAGDILRFNVGSVTDIEYVTVNLIVSRSIGP